MTNKVKELRQKFNLTQEDLARQVGVRRETIVFLEQNKYIPSLKLAFDLAGIFKTTVDDLFSFKD
ncbi:MAG: helix-turn-helix transcriptional regulator [Patescibacteria group bacterium]|jgi:putative transcriptional regulator